MHQSVMKFIADVKPDVTGLRVLEVGSCNVNGSVRPLFDGAGLYFGIDIQGGPGVDLVIPVEGMTLRDDMYFEYFDVVVSCEMLEHAEHWSTAFHAMADLLKPGGTLLLTARGPGFPRHNPPDHWRFTLAMVNDACRVCGLFVESLMQDPQVPGVFLRAQKRRMPDALPAPRG